MAKKTLVIVERPESPYATVIAQAWEEGALHPSSRQVYEAIIQDANNDVMSEDDVQLIVAIQPPQ